METEIVFAFYKEGNFQGFRADTFNTISKTYAKPYLYSKGQVETVLKNVKNGMNRNGTSFLEILMDKYGVEQEAVEHVIKSESQMRDWKDFEVRVLPVKVNDLEDLLEEEWKLNVWLSKVEPIEVHKFKLIENEN